MRLALVAHRLTAANAAIRAASRPGVDIVVLTPKQALADLEPGNIAVSRLDVLPTLDGVEEGLAALGELAARGVRILNQPSAVLAAHDKLLTARILEGAGVSHPCTAMVSDRYARPALPFPLVLKPRFGSWGRDVFFCADLGAYDEALAEIASRPWFAAQGALVQEYVATGGRDLRVVVAAGTVIGSVEREAPPGEWRTNVALGARRRPVSTPIEAALLAIDAAGAVAGDLMGVDLLPRGDTWTVLELNAAVDFTAAYSRNADVFGRTVDALLRTAGAMTPASAASFA